jgi:uncharacterized protein YcsI (UPF0317 family)
LQGSGLLRGFGLDDCRASCDEKVEAGFCDHAVKRNRQMAIPDVVELEGVAPREFRLLVRRGLFTGMTAIDPYPSTRRYAFDFLLFCNRNPRPCPILDVTDPGDPHPKLVTREADLRTDVPMYRVFREGDLIDE